MAIKWPIKVEVDCPEPRPAKSRLVIGADGTSWDRATSSEYAWFDSVTGSAMLLPMCFDGAYDTTFSGIYSRLQLSDMETPFGGTWRQYQVRGAGDYWCSQEDTTTAYSIRTATSWSANQGWCLGMYHGNIPTKAKRMVLAVAFAPTATMSMSPLYLRFFTDGSLQIFKDGVLKGQYDQEDSNKTAGRLVNGLTPMGNQYHSVVIIPHKRRELLVLTSWGLNITHLFEDLSQDSTTNTIIPAGKLQVQDAVSRQFLQFSPIRFVSSAAIYSKPIKLRYAPPTGAVFTARVIQDRVGRATGGSSVTASVVKSDLTAYTPDGVIDTVRLKVQMTSSDNIESPGVALGEAWYQPAQATTADDPVDITGLYESLSISVDETSRATLSMTARRQRLLDAGVEQPQITSDRPIRIAVGSSGASPTYIDIFRGSLTPPQIHYERRWTQSHDVLQFDGQDRTRDLELTMYQDGIVYDGMTMQSAVSDMIQTAGFLSTDLIWNDTSGFTLPRSADIARGYSTVVPQRGEYVATLLSKMKNDYAATWVTGWSPTTTGYKYQWSNPNDLVNTPIMTLYNSRQDAITAGVSGDLVPHRVIYKMSAHYESPEANQIIVLGQDPRNGDLIYSYAADGASADPTTAPASRPYNWRGRTVSYILSEPAITSDAAAVQAKNVISTRLMTGRILLEFTSDLLIDDATNRPLWLRDVVQIMMPGGATIRGIYRIIAIPSIEFGFEPTSAGDKRVVRTATYRCLYLGDGGD
jgi:hypothetical protein